jgi:hypothetical protein
MLVVERRRGEQNTLAAAQGETVLQLLCAGWGKVYPVGRRDTWQGKIPEADNWLAAPGPGLRWWHCGVAAGLQFECRHLVCLVANLQGDLMQRTPQDGVWTVVEQLEWRIMSVPLDEHRLRASQGVRELRRRLPGSSFVLSGGRGGVRQHSMF